MFTTVDKAIAGGVVSFLANWLLAHYHITMPVDVQTALSGLIVAVIVWATPNVEKEIQTIQNGPGTQNSGAKQ